MCLLCSSYHQLSLFSLKLMVGMHIHPLQWKVPRLNEECLTVQRLKNTNTSSISDFICHLLSFSSYNTCATFYFNGALQSFCYVWSPWSFAKPSLSSPPDCTLKKTLPWCQKDKVHFLWPRRLRSFSLYLDHNTCNITGQNPPQILIQK